MSHSNGEQIESDQATPKTNDPQLSDLIAEVYSELHQIAAQRMKHERPGHTLQATALVAEAYLRLADQRNIALDNPQQFLAIASNIIRRVLIEHARKKGAAKRGGQAVPVTLVDDYHLVQQAHGVDLLTLGEALEQLEQLQPRATQIIEMRFFGGYEMKQIAEALSISLRTAQNDYAFARAWLSKQLADQQPHSGN